MGVGMHVHVHMHMRVCLQVYTPAMNMVGTPYRAVQRSEATAASVASAEKPQRCGSTMAEAAEMHASEPSTMPKQ